MIPPWLTVLADVSLAQAGLSALIILIDVISHPQMMPVMNVVWPVTALYCGPLGLWAYYAIGRKSLRQGDRASLQGQRGRPQCAAEAPPEISASGRPRRAGQSHVSGLNGGSSGQGHLQKPFWQTVFVGGTHCGAGCTLGDIIAEWSIFWLGWTLAGAALWPELIADYTLAYILGIAFQFFAIAPMRHLPVGKGIWAAIKADTLSLTAFEIGLFGWMALDYFVFFAQHPLQPANPVYWFMMQVGMVIGFVTSYPMNWWLIRQGIKEAM